MVSVCMATYNGEKYVKSQIESILKQIKRNDELIISDDSSSDNTVQVIRSISDERIKLYINEHSSGRPTENFQNALTKAAGDIIFLADQDDIWLDHKYEKIIKSLETADLVLSNSIVVDESLKEINSSFFELHGSKKGVLRNAIKNSYFGSCMAFRRQILDIALPFPANREIGHDVWLGLVAECVGKVRFIDEPLILYRRHSSAVTVYGFGKSGRSLFKKLMGRVIILIYILFFFLKYLINGKRISIHHNSNV